MRNFPQFISVACVAFLFIFLTTSFAEEPPPLILDRDRPRIRVRTGEERPQEQKDQTEESAKKKEDEIDPSQVIVCIVNRRYLTLEQLNRRLMDRLRRYEEDIMEASQVGVLTTLDQNMAPDRVRESEQEIMEDQLRQFQSAMNLEMGIAMQEWMEHSILADEAFRQGLVVTETEFRQRLAEAESSTGLDQDSINAILRAFAMTRDEFEQSIYDAAMIEKLLRQYMALNFTEEQMRRAYESNPSAFYYPERYQLAHFAIALDGTESSARMRQLRSIADNVRRELNRSDDPESVFETYNDPDDGIYGAIPGWYSFEETGLPPSVRYYASMLKVGETSRVIEQQAYDSKGDIVTISLHVVKILDYEPPGGRTFDSARPTIERHLLELSRIQLLDRLMESRTHYLVSNMRGIPADRIPSQGDLNAFLARHRGGIDLRMNQ